MLSGLWSDSNGYVDKGKCANPGVTNQTLIDSLYCSNDSTATVEGGWTENRKVMALAMTFNLMIVNNYYLREELISPEL